jgi:hypothetical protein
VSNEELRAGTDVDLLLDVIAGGLLFRAAHHPELEPDLPERLATLLRDGVGRARPSAEGPVGDPDTEA